MELRKRRLELLPGLLLVLLACHFVPSQQQELLLVPDVAPYPPLTPIDEDYPANIPANLPTQLPPAPAVLLPGANTTCSTTVAAVLEANGRSLLAKYLAATPQGLLVLTGTMQATILAPTDSALKQVLGSNETGLKGSGAASTVALYHVLNGRETLNDLGEPWGRWWNTTLTKPACPTAWQAVTVFSQDQMTYARSATNAARISSGDLAACNSIVHLADQALQPCCVSLFEEMHHFSIVKIQPSVFEGYKAEETAGNSDESNRQLFEEAMVDLVLFAGPVNRTRTILWPAAAAWDAFSLDSLMPGVALDSTTRAQAMQLLALYSVSHTAAILPKDLPGPDGSAPGVTFSFDTALRNVTTGAVWGCADVLEVSAPAWGGSANQPEAGAVAEAPSATTHSQNESSTATAAVSELKASSAAGAQSERIVRLVQGQPKPERQEQQRQTRSGGVDASQPGRRLQAAAAGLSKAVNVLDVYETCEGIRVLAVDAVPVPCDFPTLVRNFGSIQSVADKSYVPPQHRDLAAALYEWLQQKGVIAPGQKVSDVQQQQRHWPWQRSSAGIAQPHSVCCQLGLWLSTLLMAWFSWGFLGL